LKYPKTTGFGKVASDRGLPPSKKLPPGPASGKTGGQRESRRSVNILSDGQQWTVARLMRMIEYRTGGQPISRTTVTSLLQELKGEGRALNINQFWKST
jgi:hypothetical protein